MYNVTIFDAKAIEVRNNLYNIYVEECRFDTSEVSINRFDKNDDNSYQKYSDELNKFRTRMLPLKRYLKHYIECEFMVCDEMIRTNKV